MKLTKEQKFREEALDEMFKRVGFDGFDQKFVDSNDKWYRRKTWTESDQCDFKNWFVKKHMKVFKAGKSYAEGDVGWFLFNYGWKCKYKYK